MRKERLRQAKTSQKDWTKVARSWEYGEIAELMNSADPCRALIERLESKGFFVLNNPGRSTADVVTNKNEVVNNVPGSPGEQQNHVLDSVSKENHLVKVRKQSSARRRHCTILPGIDLRADLAAISGGAGFHQVHCEGLTHNQRSKAMMRDTIAIAVSGAQRSPDCCEAPASSSSSSAAAPSTGASADATAGAEAGATSSAAAASTAPTVSRSTAWRHKLQAEKERRARELGEDLKPAKKVTHFNCRRCGQPRTREFGHSATRRRPSAPGPKGEGELWSSGWQKWS
ncbi:hypothetical protein AALO_G00308690 [Alosa alosa]|uniref:Uncharacterized protein n=1 Tax=Alosa alosa TaxID=278164 RepID=A0AAV6FDJ7_9TELE|nr:hypothetical protein AALO_G00308690 [Alosa alosa]